MFSGDEVQQLNGIFKSKDEAILAIKDDKAKLGEIYIYLVTNNPSEGKIIIFHQE